MPRLALLLAALLLSACLPPSNPSPPSGLTVHFIDVGQGAATLLHGPDFAILVDAGRPEGSEVVPYLRSQGVRSLDLLIGTHPHADHIGQMPEVLRSLEVKEVWLSGEQTDTRTFDQVMDAVKKSRASSHQPRSGETRSFGSLHVDVLSPAALTGDLNEGSVVIRAVYGGVAVLLPGDAGIAVEDAIIASGRTVQAHILGLAHHGSAASTSSRFLAAVRPQVAVYSAAADNPYGYPHWELVDRVTAAGTSLYGTDVNGTVVVTTDGSSVQARPQRSGVPRSPNRPVTSVR